MKHPFWIINSSLLLLLFASITFALFARPELPKQKNQKKAHTQHKEDTHAISMSSVAIIDIYTNDLFNTYKQTIAPVEQPHYTKPIPTPPQPETIHIPEELKQSFLPPLAITLKGIMTVNDNSNNSAIISDNKTTQDEIYKVGDSVEDAQIIRILPNKIILVRSNGQQETLYLTQKDALANSLDHTNDDLAFVVKKITNTIFHVDPEAFTAHITSLTDLIETFDITTVYKEGKSIGVRIGHVKSNSLASMLGFESYDIVEAINNISTTTLKNRLKIYEDITQLPLKSTITLSLLRAHNKHTITYQLEDLIDKTQGTQGEQKTESDIIAKKSQEEIEQEKIKLLKKKVTFAPTMQKILLREREKMIHEGSQARTKDFSVKHGS